MGVMKHGRSLVGGNTYKTIDDEVEDILRQQMANTNE